MIVNNAKNEKMNPSSSNITVTTYSHPTPFQSKKSTKQFDDVDAGPQRPMLTNGDEPERDNERGRNKDDITADTDRKISRAEDTIYTLKLQLDAMLKEVDTNANANEGKYLKEIEVAEKADNKFISIISTDLKESESHLDNKNREGRSISEEYAVND